MKNDLFNKVVCLVLTLSPLSAYASEEMGSTFLDRQIEMLNSQGEQILKSSDLKANQGLCEFFVAGLAVNRLNAQKSAVQLGLNPSRLASEVRTIDMATTCGRSFVQSSLIKLQSKKQSLLSAIGQDTQSLCSSLISILETDRSTAINTARALGEDTKSLTDFQLISLDQCRR